MEIHDLFPVILSVMGVLVAFYAASTSSRSLNNRLHIEKKLAQCLGESLRARKITSEISLELNKLDVCSSSEEDLEKFKNQIEVPLDEAINELLITEQELVKLSLEQPSLRGQRHYIKKLVSNSLNHLQHQ